MKVGCQAGLPPFDPVHGKLRRIDKRPRIRPLRVLPLDLQADSPLCLQRVFLMRRLALLGMLPLLLGADWPNWRGPTFDGVSTETGWSTNWPASGPRRLWTAEMGTGFASFAVSGGKVYSAGHADGQDTVWCFDALTGRVVWKHTYQCALIDNLHEGGPAATPTVDGDRVYTFSKEGQLFCFDATSGAVRWSVQLTQRTGVGTPQWGYASSARIVGEKLLLEAGRLVALNKLTGETIWQTEPFEPGYGTPAVATLGGQTCVVTFNNDGVLVATLAEGKQVGFFPRESSYDTASTTPLVVNDTIFVSSGYRNGGTMLRLEGNELVKVYDARNLSNHMATGILWSGAMFGIDGNSNVSRQCRLVCLDWATGKELWSERGFGCGSLTMADGKLLVLSDDGELAVLRPSLEKLEVITRAQVIEGRCWTVPVLANGLIYIRNADGQVVCLDVR